jgi:hypothetical protein
MAVVPDIEDGGRMRESEPEGRGCSVNATSYDGNQLLACSSDDLFNP